MARPKAFVTDEALDKAVAVFWEKGYEATSINDLVEAMGIRRGSLYATFGNKQQLFLKSLERYGQVVVQQFLDILDSQPSALESLALFFAQLVEHLMTAGPLSSCLVTNSAIERGLRDEATQKYILYLLNSLEKGFYKVLKRAQDKAEISEKVDLKSMALFLTSSMQGLLVVGKVNPNREILESINKVTLSALQK
ncbi:MAG: TetR/AcrR family transcriptional regulator [Methyloprofundus sp.]|nr:TetR/AcrR family transcriptional regulator [Methyloprofundus sp.]